MDIISIPWLALLLQGIPEQIAVVTLATTIAKLPLKWRELILMGTFLAIIANGIRVLPFPFGTHTIIILLLLFFFLTIKGKADISLSLIASLLTILALIIYELLCLTALAALFAIPKEILVDNQLIRILITEPQVVLLFLTAFLIRRKRCIYDKPCRNE